MKGGKSMNFKAATDDFQFNLVEMGLLKQVQSLSGFEEITEDLVSAVLEENARFVEEQIAPLNKVGDTQPCQWSDGIVKTPPGFKEALSDYTQAGWQALQHEVEYGGQNFPKLIATAISENLNAANLAFALCPLLTDGCVEAIRQAGTEEQKQTFIPPMLEGRWTGTMNLTEPQAGSDLALLKTKAIRQEDGTYRISGQKIFITYGEHDMADNIIHLVLARTPDAPAGVKGISLFIVPKYLVNKDGSLGLRNDVWCTSIEHKLGIHGSPTSVLVFGDNKGDVGEGAVAYLIGKENEGLAHMFVMMNEARFNVGVQGIAISQRAYQHALAYARERIQGNAIDGEQETVAIIRHPDVQRMLYTMKSLTEGARATALFTAMQQDIASHHADEEIRRQAKAVQEYMVPIVKAFSTEMSLEVTSLGVQVHGGMGFIEETGAAQYYRDARILPIYEGTTAIQANDFVGRKTWRDGGAVAKHLLAEMQKTVDALRAAESPRLNFIASQLTKAVIAYEAAIDAIVEMGVSKALHAAFSGSVPFLMLAGYVHAGWHLAKAALICEGKGTPYHTNKQDTAVFYAAHLLPRVTALADIVLAGRVVAELNFSV